MTYVVKLNPTGKEPQAQGLEWLSEYDDVFPEELPDLPSMQEVDHAIELVQGAQSIAKRPYKMYVLESIEF